MRLLIYNRQKKQRNNLQSDKMQDAKKSSHIEKIYEQIEELIGKSEAFGKSEMSVSNMERSLLKSLLKIGLQLLILAIRSRQEEIENQGPPKVTGQLTNKGLLSRPYQSLFGGLEIKHRKYYIKGRGIYYPLDDSLNLPSGKLSYVLQDWTGRGSTELDYRESVSMLNEILGLNLNGTQSKFHSNEQGNQVADFYNQQAIVPVPKSNYLCLEWDGKGVPIIKEERKENSEESATSVAARLKRGEKRGIKKTATVSVVSDFSPKYRAKESIIRGLFKSPLTPLEKQKKDGLLEVVHSKQNNWHQHIHRRAFLGNQEISINYGVNLAKKRMQGKDIPMVALVDGGIGLEGNMIKAFEQQGIRSQLKYIILDIVHVSEYVWKAGNAILGENSNLRTGWVKDVLSDILDSKISKVIENLKDNLKKTKLSKSAKKQLNKTITYFTNHQHKMDYKVYLDQGLPVSTALVESSCGHLVKDRMERSGMRWSINGAQNMMDARAVKKNGDWAEFMDFVIFKNQDNYRKKTA